MNASHIDSFIIEQYNLRECSYFLEVSQKCNSFRFTCRLKQNFKLTHALSNWYSQILPNYTHSNARQIITFSSLNGAQHAFTQKPETISKRKVTTLVFGPRYVYNPDQALTQLFRPLCTRTFASRARRRIKSWL